MATFTTPVTLVEAARTGKLGERDTALIETFLDTNTTRPGMPLSFWEVMPWLDVPGSLEYSFQRELGLPTITPRSLNQTVTRSVGSTEVIKESLKIYPAEFMIDEALMRTTAGAQLRAIQQSLHAKAILSTVQNHFFKGDSATTAAQLDGLQSRITGTQLVSEGNTSGGDPCQVSTLRQAIDLCYGPNRVMFMGKGLSRRFDAAVGLASIGASIREGQTAWGRKATFFDDIPIIPVSDLDGTDNVLGFTEAGAGGGSTATSIYICSLGFDSLHGLRNGGLLDWNLPSGAAGEQARLNEMMFLPGLAIKRPQAVVRHYGISDAALIA